jgi:TolA-binding protein
MVSGSGDGLRARVNTGGPDDWPAIEGLSTELPVETASAPEAVAAPTVEKVAVQAQPAPAGEKKEEGKGEAKKPEPEVIYVDEHGNPVPKPLDVNATLADARKLLQSLQFEPAKDLLLKLKPEPMPPEKREELLYLLSDANAGLYNGKWLEGFEPIVASTSEAMNANLRSPQVPRALERLGMINLRTGNQQDAAGYFGAMHSRFPMDPKVAECFYDLGMDQMEHGQYAEAVQNFQLVMREYPESQAVRKAARYMAEALYKQGHYERAMTIIDFVDRRWPRIYIDDPAYLLMVADTEFRRGRLEDALQTYWTYYNLTPNAAGTDQLLLNVGTIYMMLGDMDSARTMYSELLRRYPDSQYAPLAVLRQGEEGIFEGNLPIDDIFAMFGRPNLTTLPEVAYRRLIQDYPNSKEAETAALRQAVWRLWNKDYSEAMDLAEAFIRDHPNSLYTPRADEIILRAFAVDLAMDLEEENYDRILQYWDRFPQVRGAYTPPSDSLRMALARAHLNRGDEDEGYALLQPFLDRPQDSQYGEYVYKMNLAKALRTEDWKGILDLGAKVENWKLPEDERNQIVYAMAIARENLGQGQEAVPLWAKLYKKDDIPLYQKAYANYFMARDAERRRSIEDAYQLNKDTLDLFTRLGVENPERADPARIQESLVGLMDVTEVANRFAEALEWADQYEPFVPESSPEYSAFRFRLARLHRKMGDLARWQYMLEDIVKREPDSVYGKMAASELRTQSVARDLSRFQQPSDASGGKQP